MKQHRQALVVGINNYPCLREEKTREPQDLTKPATDAAAIAQILEKYGDFRVQRLPEYHQGGKRGVDPAPRVQNLVTVTVLEKAIAQLFNPPGRIIPDTAVLFFAGHGLRKDQGEVSEGFLATSDANPQKGNWGVSLRWLCQLLQKSPVRQQIVWLDCCYSGELWDILKEANPGTDGKALDRCLIAACRGFEVSREQLQGEHGIFTAALLQGLDPENDVDGWVSNKKLADFINKQMSAEPQHPIFHNSGGAIILTDKTHGVQRQVNPELKGKCPYKSLEYFTKDDATFFHGRTALTDELINKVRTENFIAVLGASGSGKSSVLRAGLLAQLNRGQKLSGSDRWQYYDPFTPGEHPLQSFKEAIGKDTKEFKQFIATLENERVVLVVDQFEECFTMCQDSKERKEFFTYLLEAVEQAKNKLCLVLGMRADFLGKCTEYVELADKIDQHLVTVKPMNRTEIEEAIKKPAELVGLQVQEALVTEMTKDVLGSPGSLPLLQYTLTELWKEAREGSNRNWLTLESYNRLGGIEKTLPKRANDVYESLNEEEKPVAKRIFLELTQLGEVSDTRRRVVLQDLVNQQHSPELLNAVTQRLVEARLITADAKDVSANKPDLGMSNWLKAILITKPAPTYLFWFFYPYLNITTKNELKKLEEPRVVLDIVHESLIRHWEKLRQWVKDNQIALETERKIEARAKEWERQGKIDDQGLLLQGATLREAEAYLDEYRDLGLLDGIAEEFIESSKKFQALQERDKEQQIAQLEQAITKSQLWANSAQVLNLLHSHTSEALKLAIETMGLNLDQFPKADVSLVENLAKYPGKILGVVQGSLYEVVTSVSIQNTLRGSEIRGHESCVTCVAFSPDSKLIVSSSWDKTVRLWDMEGNPIGQPFQGHEGFVYSVAFSPDGQRIVSGSADKTVRLWDMEGNPIGQPFQGHEDSVYSIAFSPDGTMIVTGSADKMVRLWDMKGNPIGQPWQGHRGYVTSVAFSPDGQRIISSSWDKTVRLWNMEGKLVGQPWQGHKDYVNSVAFSPDGKRIVTGSADKTVRLWDIEGNPIGQPWQGHKDYVNSVAFSPDGKRIVTGSWDKTVRLWDMEGQPIGQLWRKHKGYVNSVAFSPDSKRIVTGSNDKTICLWDIQDNSIGQPFQGHEESVNSVAFSPDGQRIVSGSADKTVRLWDMEGNSIGQPFQGHESFVSSVAFSPDGKRIVSGSADKTVRLWDMEGNPIGQPFQGHEGFVYSVAFSPDGQRIVSGSWDKTVRLWDMEGNPIGQPFQGHEGFVYSVAFSPDGQRIVSGSWDKTVRLWDMEGNPIGQPFQGHEDSVSTVAFSPDGKMIVSGSWDSTVRLWDMEGNLISQPFQGHEDYVNSVAFSPDEQMIISGSWNKTVRLWDMKGNPIGQPWREHEGCVNSVAFSPDGKRIVSGSNDKTVRLWEGGWQAWLPVCCDRLAYHLIFENPEIDTTQGAFKVCKEYAWSNTDLVKILMRQGNNLARQGKVEEAIAKFQQALEYDPTLNLHPDTEARRLAPPTLICQDEDLVRQDEDLAKLLVQQMYPKEAIAKLQQALEYNPTMRSLLGCRQGVSAFWLLEWMRSDRTL